MLLRKIDIFLHKAGMTESRFGRNALNDPAFVRRLRNSAHSPRQTTIERIEKYISSYESDPYNGL